MMQPLLAAHDSAKWTVVTYLPFLWAPGTHMFLKPQVTCSFAERVGHGFAGTYAPGLDAQVYAGLLALMDDTRAAISAMKPRDNIDLQSFVWVVGEYQEQDATDLAAAMAG